jgi:hypothetical protein
MVPSHVQNNRDINDDFDAGNNNDDEFDARDDDVEDCDDNYK